MSVSSVIILSARPSWCVFCESTTMIWLSTVAWCESRIMISLSLRVFSSARKSKIVRSCGAGVGS